MTDATLDQFRELAAKFREREVTNYKLSRDIESKSLEKSLRFQQLSMVWAADAEEIERVLRENV